MLDLLSFGAAGDGRTLNTAAFARAIAAIHAQGGGTLIVPPGVYRTGTISPCDHLTLQLENGAVLVGSENRADYVEDKADAHHDNQPFALIEARHVHDFTIQGSGVIDGNGPEFWEKVFRSGRRLEDAPPEHSPLAYDVLFDTPRRPTLVRCTGCTDITVTGVTLRNSACYNLWLIGCDRVRVSGLRITCPHYSPNTDGIDVDCSRFVRISDCEIDTGDDCIAIKSDPHRAETFQPCSDITVTNCTFRTPACGVRIGYEGDSPISDCVLSNLSIRGALIGLDIVSVTPTPNVIRIDHGACIDRIGFSDIVMRNVGQAFYLWAGDEPPRHDYQAHVRDISYSNILAECCGTSFLGADRPGIVKGLSFQNLRLTVTESNAGQPPYQDVMPSLWNGAAYCGAMRLRYVDGVRFNGARIRSAQHPVLRQENVSNLTTSDCTFEEGI